MNLPTWHLKSIGAILFAGIFATLAVWQPQNTSMSPVAATAGESLHSPSPEVSTRRTSPPISANSAATTTWKVFLPAIWRPPDISWPMAGGNPQMEFPFGQESPLGHC